MNQGALHFDALLSVNNFDQGITRIKNGIREASGVAKKEAEQMDSYFRNLGTAIGGYFTAQSLFSFTKELINVRGEFQKTEIAFTTMLGSADKARQLMGQMVTLAAETPFGLEDVSAGAKQLLAFQVPANQVVDVLTRMGNIAAGLGVPLSRINLVYGQVRAKGKLMGDDMRQFTEAGIPMIAELAKHFGVAESAITEMVSAGKVGFKDVEAVLFNLTNEGGMFFNLMEKQSASLSGKVANLEDTWDQMLNKIGEGNEGILYSGIEGLTYLVEHYEDLLNIIESLIVIYGSYKAALIVTAAAQNFSNKTIQSEIALLSISEKMKLGRAMVTQRQAEATAKDTAAEVVNIKAKYESLQADVRALAIKKQVAIQSGVAASAKAQEARVQLSLARMELSSIQATGTARQIELAQKRVEIAQNTVISTQESASIARKATLAAAIEFNTAQQQLQNTAKTLGAATTTASTAAEAAETAAKTANAIATTRLTIATRLRTAATQLLTTAQALLNATMLNNPIVIVIAAAAALTYAYFRLRDTSTALTIAEKLLNDERERSSKQIEDLKNKTQELTAVINSDTTTKLQQIEAYQQLGRIYPSLLKDMDLETFKKLGSTEAQKKLNAEIDKFSTQKLKEQIDNSKKTIDELKLQIDGLNERLKKRDGDSGIYLNQLEFATKNLEAQKINLEKYNEQYRQRIENEKISSLSMAQQKQYWEEQVKSITNQISGLEKSNSKKAEGIDKLNNLNSLAKSTSIALLNWNISPLLSQLSRAQSEINKINNAQSDKGIDKNKAYWEEQRKAAAEANDAMSGRAADPKVWDANIAKYREATEQLKKYDYSDKELLKAQKERDKERKALEKGAEKAYLLGSVKRYDQQISLLEEALSRSTGDNVQTRYIDKYGKERNSKELLTVKQVNDQIIDLREKRAERERMIEIKSFQDQIDEAERQWNNYYKLSEYYGKETADAQYSELFKDAKNYLEYLEKQEQVLRAKQSAGILTEQEKKDILFLQQKISELNGTETPFENIKREIESALKSISSLFDQQEFLENFTADLFKKEGNSKLFLDVNKYAEDLNRNILQQRRDAYSEFLKEEENFQKQQTDIIAKWDDIRKKLQEKADMSLEEKTRLKDRSYKLQGEELSTLSLKNLQKTDLWVKAFGDLDRVGTKSLLKLRDGLLQYLAVNKNLAPTELKAIQEQILKIEEIIGKRNPFEAITIAVQNYKKKREELNEVEKKFGKNSEQYKNKLKEVQLAFVQIIEVSGAAANAMIDIVVSVGDAFGGLSDDLKQTLAEVQQLIDGIVNTVAGYFSGNYGQMISGIVQIVGAMVKLLSGDKGRERQIKEWQNAVDGLKTSYNELQYAIEKTAGEASLAMNRGLIENLEEQKRLLIQMRDEESKKKKSDAGKIASLNDQISQVNQQINDVIDNFKKQIVGTEFKDLSQRLADALISAFGQGENAAEAFDKVVEDVMRNAVANALKMKFLDEAAQNIVNSIYSSMGFGNGATNFNDGKIKEAEYKIAELEKQIKQKESQSYSPALAQEVLDLKKKRQELLDLIGKLKAEMASVPAGGSFDGLSKEERDKIKAQAETAMQQYMAALQQYEDLFGSAAENAQGLKGDIKGITEKTAGALEAQINAMRINIVAILKIHQTNQKTFQNQLNVLSQIEINTRNLVGIRKDISEMNAKMKKSLAGVP